MVVGFCATSLASAPVATPSAPAKGINGGAEVGLDLNSPGPTALFRAASAP
jgi:hypothetical protein